MGPVELVMLLGALVPVLLLVGAVVLLLWIPGPDVAARAAAGRAGLVGPAPQPLRRAVLRSRRWSGAGLAVGIAAGALPTRGSALAGAVTGFLLGAAAAAAAPRPAPTGSQRVASLVPRRLDEYISAAPVQALRAAALLCAAVAAAGALLPSRPAFALDAASWLLLGCAPAVVALLVEAGARRIVLRAQYAATPDEVRVDDVVRSFSVHALVGSGLALVLLLLASSAWNAGASSDVQLLRWSLPVLGVLALLAAPIAWVRIARRFEGLGRTAAPALASG